MNNYVVLGFQFSLPNDSDESDNEDYTIENTSYYIPRNVISDDEYQVIQTISDHFDMSDRWIDEKVLKILFSCIEYCEDGLKGKAKEQGLSRAETRKLIQLWKDTPPKWRDYSEDLLHSMNPTEQNPVIIILKRHLHL
jgi:hypothetical protein